MRIFYAQSGGVTATINATCAGLLDAAAQHQDQVLIGLGGIHGLLQRRFFNGSTLSCQERKQLSLTPGGSFGSCRYKLQAADYPIIVQALKEENIEAFVYQGGNDSMDTCLKIANLCEQENLPITVLGLPKTIDNDLFGTDCAPGFGSASKYLNVSFDEASLDMQSMCYDSTKVFISETMGRHSGWLAASCGLTRHSKQNHILLIPEKTYCLEDIKEKVLFYIQHFGFVTISVSEGVNLPLHSHSSGLRDAFGHQQLGGVGQSLKSYLQAQLNVKVHLAISDYFQRSAGHCLSKVDFEQSYAIGRVAYERLQEKRTAVMLTIERVRQHPYAWKIGESKLCHVANKERLVPDDFINEHFQLTTKGREYFAPLIVGQVQLPWENGLPVYWPHRLSVQESGEDCNQPHQPLVCSR